MILQLAFWLDHVLFMPPILSSIDSLSNVILLAAIDQVEYIELLVSGIIWHQIASNIHA